MKEGSPSGRSLVLRAVVVASGFLLAVGLFGVVQYRRGAALMAESDASFHRGELRISLHQARDAGLLFVPGAPHVQAAEERLSALGKGAESEGDLELARLAWDALRLIDEETSYPGRGNTAAGETARQALKRLERK